MGVSIQGLFETHLTVRNLATSVAFYRDIVELSLAYLLPERRVAFFWIGGRVQGISNQKNLPDSRCLSGDIDKPTPQIKLIVWANVRLPLNLFF